MPDTNDRNKKASINEAFLFEFHSALVIPGECAKNLKQAQEQVVDTDIK